MEQINIHNKYYNICILIGLIFVICLLLSTPHIYLSILGSLLLCYLIILLYFITNIIILLIYFILKCLFCLNDDYQNNIDNIFYKIIQKYNFIINDN